MVKKTGTQFCRLLAKNGHNPYAVCFDVFVDFG